MDQAVNDLDIIGIREATDKTSLVGDYLRHYENIFGAMRHEEFNFIEIGVLNGASARTWERFFSRARIIGVDIDPNCRRYTTDRVTIEIGSQNNPDFLHKIAAAYPPRVIIDDGSHQSYDVIFTFERLFPTLLPGGIYVIEDLHFHLLEHEAERLRGGSPILAHEYVVNLTRDLLGSEDYARRIEGLRGHLIRSIDRIEIIRQAAVIHKRAVSADPLATLIEILPHIEASNHWLSWLSYSQKLLAAGAAPPVVVSALKRSVSLNGTVVINRERLAEALERAGDIGSAIDALEKATAIAGTNRSLTASIQERIQRLRGLPPR